MATPFLVRDGLAFKPDGYTVAVIGHTGRGNYGHGLDTLWLGVDKCRLIAVADPDSEGLAKARSRLGAVKGYNDYGQMLEAEKPDIVSIAPRHVDQHRDIAIAAIKSGVKGIYIEKPFCRNLAEADEIVAACKAAGVKLAVAHRNRYHPALPVAQRMVAEGKLGKVLEVRARGKEDQRGGVLDLWVLGSHVLNLIPLFTGAFTGCSATLHHGNKLIEKRDLTVGDEGVGLVGGDRLHARFTTEKGIAVFFDSIKGGGKGSFGFQLLGTEGVLDFRIDTEPLVSFASSNLFFPQQSPTAWTPVTSGGVGVQEPVPGIVEDIAGHQAAARDLIKAIAQNGTPLCNELEGRATVETIMGVFESHRRGGAFTSFPLSVSGNPLLAL